MLTRMVIIGSLGCVAAVTCNDSHVLSCDYDGEVKLWSAKKGDLLSTVDVSTAGSKQVIASKSKLSNVKKVTIAIPNAIPIILISSPPYCEYYI